mmetsp:Transcript_5331/g.7486  ORF Transcript_5331/g.7486 Transcript_5331/m.7486 type:complete len:92 (+) Transcript_5331:294-569(+)
MIPPASESSQLQTQTNEQCSYQSTKDSYNDKERELVDVVAILLIERSKVNETRLAQVAPAITIDTRKEEVEGESRHHGTEESSPRQALLPK